MGRPSHFDGRAISREVLVVLSACESGARLEEIIAWASPPIGPYVAEGLLHELRARGWLVATPGRRAPGTRGRYSVVARAPHVYSLTLAGKSVLIRCRRWPAQCVFERGAKPAPAPKQLNQAALTPAPYARGFRWFGYGGHRADA